MRVLYSVVCTRHDTAFVQIRYRDSCRVPRDSTDTVWTAMDRRVCKRKEPGLDYKLYSYRNSYCNSLIRNPDQSFLVSLLYADIRYEEERKTGDGSADNSFGLNDSAQCAVLGEERIDLIVGWVLPCVQFTSNGRLDGAAQHTLMQ